MNRRQFEHDKFGEFTCRPNPNRHYPQLRVSTQWFMRLLIALSVPNEGLRNDAAGKAGLFRGTKLLLQERRDGCVEGASYLRKA